MADEEAQDSKESVHLTLLSSVESSQLGVRNTFLEFYSDDEDSATVNNSSSRRRSSSAGPSPVSAEARKEAAVALARTHLESLAKKNGSCASCPEEIDQMSHRIVTPGIRGGGLRPVSVSNCSTHSSYSQLVAESSSDPDETKPLQASGESDATQSNTTVMIRHIACRYTPEKVKGILDEAGLQGKYNFLHLPMNPRKRANLGYMFVNFTSPDYVRACREEFNGKVFGTSFTQKRCEVVLAFTQSRGKVTKQHLAHLTGATGDNEY